MTALAPRATPDAPVLVAGCGSIGRRHLRNLASLGIRRLLTVDPEADSAADAAASVNGTAIDSLDNLPPLAAAFICTPTSHHIAPAEAALARGAHLFIEKPIASVMEGVQELLNRARAANRLVMVGFNMRFHPSLKMLKRELEAGTIGRPLSARLEFGQYLPDWHPWEDYREGYSARRDLGGGIVLDATHEFDYARWLFGDVTSVIAHMVTTGTIDIETEDLAAVILQHKTGTVSEIHVDYLQRIYGRGCKVIGTEGTLVWNWNWKAVRRFRSADGSWREFAEDPDYDINSSYLEEVSAFLDAVERGVPPPIDGTDAARVLEIALAAKQASAEGRMVHL